MILKIDLPGTCFRAVFIPKGETPENFPDTKDDEYDIIEFYDRDYPFTPDGQFTAGRYRAETILKSKDDNHLRNGLCLHGGIPKWNIPGNATSLLLNWLERCVA